MSHTEKAYSPEEIEKNRAELLKKAEGFNGKTIGELDTTGLLNNPKNKGDIGQVIQIALGKSLDSSKEMDFPEAKLELKVTGVLSSKKKEESYHAKERLVLTMVNYQEDYKLSFEKSHILEKCDNLLITVYRYEKPKDGSKANYGQFVVVTSFHYALSEKDKAIIKQDYDEIISKIKNGEADKISESDTNYLSACTKAADSNARRSQPFSSTLAKPRAFAFKAAYLTQIIHEKLNDETYQSIVDKVDFLKTDTLENYVIKKLKPWFGKTEDELSYEFGVMSNAKNRYAMYADRIFKVSSLQKSEEFLKADIVVKTIRIQKSGTIKEKMSFPQMDFIDVANTRWEDSAIRSYFAEKKFLFLIYKETEKGMVFSNAFFYNFTDAVIEDFIGYTYKKTQETLRNGEIVSSVATQIVKGEVKLIHKTNFVGIAENPICHVRPHGLNFKDQKPLPAKDKVTGYTSYEKQCFWIDTRFIDAIIKGIEKRYIEDARKHLKNIN